MSFTGTKMRLHVLGVPHTVSNKDYVGCAYTQKVVKFCKMMKDHGGYELIHYGHEDSQIEVDEHVTVVDRDLFNNTYDEDWKNKFFKYSTSDPVYQTFYKNAIQEIQKRKQSLDFILPFWGSGVKPVCDAFDDLITVEPGIGYGSGSWAPYKVFESYAIYHAYLGLSKVARCDMNWYEVVIPNYFELSDFTYNTNKEDYFLYLGRVYDGKGVNIAIQACKKLGKKLVIAGQKEEGYDIPEGVEYVGYADTETRRRLMSNAKASFLPSQYLEPFGGVQIENLLSGTPTITTDWGAFSENNIQGHTGFRCRTFEDFINAVDRIDEIDPSNCRKYGENFSLEKVGPRYHKYFSDVQNLYKNTGWYHIGGDSLDTMTLSR